MVTLTLYQLYQPPIHFVVKDISKQIETMTKEMIKTYETLRLESEAEQEPQKRTVSLDGHTQFKE